MIAVVSTMVFCVLVHKIPWCGNRFLILCEGNPVSSGFLSQSTSHVELWCFFGVILNKLTIKVPKGYWNITFWFKWFNVSQESALKQTSWIFLSNGVWVHEWNVSVICDRLMIPIFHEISLAKRPIQQEEWRYIDTPLQWRHNGCDGSQITGVSIDRSTVWSGEDQRKRQNSASLVFVGGNLPVTRKMFPFADVTSACKSSKCREHMLISSRSLGNV